MKTTLTLAVVVVIAGAGSALGETALEQAQRCAGGNCWQTRDSQSLPADVTGTESPDAALRLATAGRNNSRRRESVPDLTVQPPKKHHLFGKKKMLGGLLAAGAGAYAAHAFGASALGFAGPWGAAAIGAAAGLLLAFFILPKLFKMFHHKKN